jgi:hypothetical protein
MKVDVPLMTTKELDALVSDVLFVEAWAAAVRAEILKALESGAIMENATLEPKRGLRKWDVEESVVSSTLSDLLASLGRNPDPDVFAPRKVVTPAQSEKLVGKRAYDERLSSLVTSESSGYNLKLR